MSLSVILKSLSHHCHGQVRDKHVLAISDTSEINLQAHAGRLKKDEKLGVVGNNQDIGFFIHPTLVVDSADGLPLGLSTVQIWTRPEDRPSKEERDYKNQPIEEKESYKWIESAKGSQWCFEMGEAEQVTYIGDSESDIYEPWIEIPKTHVNLLIRACRDRVLADSELSLFEYLSAQPIVGHYTLDVPADPRISRVARQATMAVRLTPVRIQRPKRLKGGYPDQVKVYAVDAIEVEPPVGQKQVHWRLLTTHRVDTYEQALQIIQWYR